MGGGDSLSEEESGAECRPGRGGGVGGAGAGAGAECELGRNGHSKSHEHRNTGTNNQQRTDIRTLWTPSFQPSSRLLKRNSSHLYNLHNILFI